MPAGVLRGMGGREGGAAAVGRGALGALRCCQRAARYCRRGRLSRAAAAGPADEESFQDDTLSTSHCMPGLTAHALQQGAAAWPHQVTPRESRRSCGRPGRSWPRAGNQALPGAKRVLFGKPCAGLWPGGAPSRPGACGPLSSQRPDLSLPRRQGAGRLRLRLPALPGDEHPPRGSCWVSQAACLAPCGAPCGAPRGWVAGTGGPAGPLSAPGWPWGGPWGWTLSTTLRCA